MPRRFSRRSSSPSVAPKSTVNACAATGALGEASASFLSAKSMVNAMLLPRRGSASGFCCASSSAAASLTVFNMSSAGCESTGAKPVSRSGGVCACSCDVTEELTSSEAVNVRLVVDSVNEKQTNHCRHIQTTATVILVRSLVEKAISLTHKRALGRLA